MTEKRPVVRHYFPPNRLAELTGKRGGMTRERAIAAAQENLEPLRAQTMSSIESAMRAIEDVAEHAQSRNLTRDELNAILTHSDRVVTLAGTFDFVHLTLVARSLCELAGALTELEEAPSAPIHVHLRAARLFLDRDDTVPEEEAQLMLAQLEKVTSRFRHRPSERDILFGRTIG